jgi:hypothetical protein
LDIYSAQMVAITSVIISMGGIHVVIWCFEDGIFGRLSLLLTN